MGAIMLTVGENEFVEKYYLYMTYIAVHVYV